MKKQKASVLLLTLLITSVLSLFTLSVWHKASSFLSLNIDREEYYKNLEAGQALFDIGTTFILKNFNRCYEKLSPKENVIILDASSWLEALNLNGYSTAIFTLKIAQSESKIKKIRINFTLGSDDSILCSLSCYLIQSDLGKSVKEYFTINDLI